MHFGFAPLKHGNRITVFSQLKVGFRNTAVDILTALIHMSINFQTESQARIKESFTSTYTDFDRRKIIWDKTKIPAYQQAAASALSNAISYWNTPETIPLLSSLLPRLLVQCATMIFDSKVSLKTTSPRQPSLKVRQAMNRLQDDFRKWKQAGRPAAKSDPTRIHYTDSRSFLQRLLRL